MWNKIKEVLKKIFSKKWVYSWITFLIAIQLGMSIILNIGKKPVGDISYSDFIANIENKNITQIIATDYSNTIVVKTKEPIETLQYKNAVETRRHLLEDNDLSIYEEMEKKYNQYPTEQQIEELKTAYEAKKYAVTVTNFLSNFVAKPDFAKNHPEIYVVQKSFISALSSVIVGFIPTFLIIFLLFYFMRNGSGLIGTKIEKNKETPNVKLSDVVGIEEDLKYEITEIIDFMKEPAKYSKLNVKKPKGVLMIGPPGVGKTMLAKAIANEAGVDFFYKSASDLENPYVGMSAKTVKTLFEEARKSKNAIIFIDEIDSIGSRSDNKKYDNGLVNAMLTEMDGFTENENVIIIAATNYPEKLDKALLREGRFDRKISIPLPNVKNRAEIINKHLENKKVDADVDIDVLAKLTTSYSGAELAGIVNEAAIEAVRRGSAVIKQEHLMAARDKKIMGVPYKEFAQSDKQKEITAYHEAGHAVLSLLLDKNNELYKVSILPRTGSLGVTVLVPIEENVNYNKTDLENRIKILFGGRIAEEIFFNEISTGASNDIERANDIVDKMVKEWGMSNLGMLNINNAVERKHSEHLLESVDKEKQIILNKNYEEAKDIIVKNSELLKNIALALIEYEEIDLNKIKEIMEGKYNPKEEKQQKAGLFSMFSFQAKNKK